MKTLKLSYMIFSIFVGVIDVCLTTFLCVEFFLISKGKADFISFYNIIEISAILFNALLLLFTIIYPLLRKKIGNK